MRLTHSRNVLLALLLTTAPAMAAPPDSSGGVDPINRSVRISVEGAYAVGVLAHARATQNMFDEHIGCRVASYWTGFANMSCSATSGSAQASCVSENPEFIAAVGRMTSESRIFFTWDVDGTCLHMSITNSSLYKPAATAGF
jgi:hypothetical protein